MTIFQRIKPVYIGDDQPCVPDVHLKNAHTVLTVVVPQGVGPGDLILLAQHAPPSERGRGSADPEERASNARIRNAMTARREVARDHDTTEVGEHGEDLTDLLIELVVRERGDWGRDSRMNAIDSPIRLNGVPEDGRAGLSKAKAEGFATDGAGTAVKQSCDANGATHLEGVLEERTVNYFGWTTASTGVESLDDRQRRTVRGVDGLVARGVEVGDHAGETVLQGPELERRDETDMLQEECQALAA